MIAASDPGVANWVDTSGLETGFMFLRVQGVRGSAPASLSCKVMSIAVLRDALPADDPVFDAKMRASAARMRRLSADRRFA